MLFGTFQAFTDSRVRWSNICAVGDATSVSDPITDPDSGRFWSYDLDALGPATTVCPAAITVQIMNPNSLQTTSGIVYAGVMNTQADFSDAQANWAGKWEEFVQFQGPRIMAAAKLALRGVVVDSYPLNMAAVSEFAMLQVAEASATFTWGTSSLRPVGWAPIMVYNPNGIELEYLVTTEWRVRFDLTSPAAASHSHHGVTSDATWDTAIRKAVSLGHGVKDIVEQVAQAGAAVQAAAALVG